MPKKKLKLQLYVWTGFCPDYSSGLAFAIAEDVTQAAQLIIEARGFAPHDWGTLTVRPLDQPYAQCVSGGA
jgi:hypothetical protein